MTKLYSTLRGDKTAVNLSSFQNFKSSLYRSRLQRFPTCASNTRRDWVQGGVDSNSPLGGLPASEHWAKWSKLPCSFCNSWQFREVLRSWNHLYRYNFQGQSTVVLLQYMLCIMASTSVTQSTASQHLESITFLIFPLCQLSTLSIPIWSTSHFVNIDQMGID